MKMYLNKKTLLFIGLIILGARAMGQDNPEITIYHPADTATKSVIESVPADIVVFEYNNVEERDSDIAIMESNIEKRLKQGKTKEELSKLYRDLELMKNAKLKSPENHE